jgi:hypothetical protein
VHRLSLAKKILDHHKGLMKLATTRFLNICWPIWWAVSLYLMR